MSAEILRVSVLHENDAVVVEVLAPLTRTELSRMGQLEESIRRSMQSFVQVGGALKEIRDGRLYRASHNTFEAYCKEQWDFGRQYAFLMIGSSDVVANVNNCLQTVPTRECQCRPLMTLAPEQQQAAWHQVNRVNTDVSKLHRKTLALFAWQIDHDCDGRTAANFQKS